MSRREAGVGPAGAVARAFVESKLTALIIAASLLLGGFAVARLAREEEPQINVPMFDVFVPFPGADAGEVERRVVDVGERKLWEIPGVEYVYSTAEAGQALFIVRFKVGTDPDQAMTRVYTKTFANLDLLPAGVMPPLIKPRSIDDVPILALTLSGPGLDGLALRRAAAALREELNAVPDVSNVELIGGRRRQFLVHFDPAALAARRLALSDVAAVIQGSNAKLLSGRIERGDSAVAVETDAFLRTADDLGNVVLGVSGGRPIRLRDVARVSDSVDEDEQDVSVDGAPAVTLALSKRRGANATRVSREALARAERLKPALPAGLRIDVTRDYGRTAKEKSDELLFHMALATISVAALIALALGAREALVVLVAIPVTLCLTLLVYFMLGYTLNRITLFALIFSIGILVDDAIVVVENIHRHYAMDDGRPLAALAVDAVAEVGNPTILATWAVIAAILPMAFVGGLMGPYMRPIPVGASFAMLFSLAIAFIVSPWAFIRVLRAWKPAAKHAAGETRLDRAYRATMRSLLEKRGVRAGYFAGMGALLLGALSLVALKLVTVKMLPFDNKDEFDVVLDMPENASYAATRRAASEIDRYLKTIPEVERVVEYTGTAAPYNFNGLVRHYFLRQRPSQAELAVQLTGRGRRKRQSHDIAREARGPIAGIAGRYGARVQVAEVPPGPPVLSTLVFELYAADSAERSRLAARLKAILSSAPGIVDVDTYEASPQPLERLSVDREKATLNAVAPAQIAEAARAALDGGAVGLAHTERDKEPVEIRLRLPAAARGDLAATRGVAMISRNGTPIPIRELTSERTLIQEAPIYHKNLRRVSYVLADVSGKQEAPIYAILSLQKAVRGLGLVQYFAGQPDGDPGEKALKWDGEWQITYEVFRDLGVAFALVLLLIYILVVAWFQSFAVPLVIMAPIPLTLVGILPAHWLLGAFFTATSMIGFIAGAGIVVRNSIILVDFIELRRAEGAPLEQAVIDAGAVRFRPMLLTAAAVVAGAAVILFDPIFQGLAVSLMAGEVASTLLSRTAVPVLYFLLRRRQEGA